MCYQCEKKAKDIFIKIQDTRDITRFNENLEGFPYNSPSVFIIIYISNSRTIVSVNTLFFNMCICQNLCDEFTFHLFYL